MDQADIDNRTNYHPAVTQDRQDAHETVRYEINRVMTAFNGYVPDGREKSLAMTKLEEAMFWANAAVARQDGPAPDDLFGVPVGGILNCKDGSKWRRVANGPNGAVRGIPVAA